jgi:hypothetical protein
MSFADVEDRATASAMARVTNATVSFDAGATSVPAIFDNGAAAVMNGLAQSAQPSMYVLASDFGSHKQGDACIVTQRGVSTHYKLRGPLPDGAGMVACALELVTS